MNHLETLIKQYYEWKGYIVRNNIKVGRLSRGGWAGELDIVAYHPVSKHLLHLEPSLDAQSWKTREKRFKKKFDAGKKYIRKDVFPWLKQETRIEQIAVLVVNTRKKLGDGTVISIDEFAKKVKTEVAEIGIIARKAIPEQFDLLRTIQMVMCGYYRVK